MNWGMTERKEPCQLNQLIHILLIEGQLFILITLMPSFAVLCLHCHSHSSLAHVLSLLHQNVIYELTVVAL